MDRTTNLALRAILRGLRDSGAISDAQLAEVAAALHGAERSARAQHACDAYDLLRLATDVGREAQLPHPAAQAPAASPLRQ